jgi:hypothetical protein
MVSCCPDRHGHRRLGSRALDGVDGTTLYIRASLVREDVTFPHFNTIGTTCSPRVEWR